MFLIANTFAICFNKDYLLTYLLLLILFQLRYQTSDAPLKLAVFGGVDERVDTAVGEHQDQGEVVQPTSKINVVAEWAE